MPSCLCCAGPHGRRAFHRGLLSAATVAVLTGSQPRSARAASPVPHTSLTGDQALQVLKDGNDAFRADKPRAAADMATTSHQRRIELARGQAPFCVLVGCSDSRVPPEVLFGRGLGELFIVRNAGNTVDTAALGSIEYGVGVLGVPLVVVLGHESCGAVSAAVDMVEKDATFPGVIGEMIQPIVPAVLSVRNQGGSLLDNAVRANARRVAIRLKTQSQVIKEAVNAGRVKIVAARYGLQEGDVTWMEDV